MLALFARDQLGRFLVSYDVPEDCQGAFQLRLAKIMRVYAQQMHRVLQSVIETIGIEPAQAVLRLAEIHGGKACIYLVSVSQASASWEPRARRAIGFFNDEPPLIEMEREHREPKLPLGFN